MPHQRLYQASNGWTTTWNTNFRFYIGGVQNIRQNDQRLYLALQNTSGNMQVQNTWSISSDAQNIVFSGDHVNSPTYYELYIHSTSNEKIILSSGYVGGKL